MLLVLVPGPDFAVVTKNALAGGRRRGSWASAGVATSNFVQGTAAEAIRSAVRGRHELADGGQSAATDRPFAGWRQGFLSNITNPKVLVFYLAVLPQFLVPGASPGWMLALAWSHAALSLSWLLALTAAH